MKYETWTEPYCGISHLGRLSVRHAWVTIAVRKKYTVLHCHLPIDGETNITCKEYTYKHTRLAKAAGRKFYNTGRFPKR